MSTGKFNRRLEFELTNVQTTLTLPIRNVEKLSYIEAIVPQAQAQPIEVAAGQVRMRVSIDNLQLQDNFVDHIWFRPDDFSQAKAVNHPVGKTKQVNCTVESLGLGDGERLIVALTFDGLIGVQ